MQGLLSTQKLIYDELVASVELIAKLGGPRIYDDVPERKKPPYVTFGKIISKQWNTDTEFGMEHLLELIAWSNSAGRKDLVEISDLIVAALIDLTGSVDGQAIVNFGHQKTETEYDASQKHFKSTLTFRVLSEPED